MKHVFVMLWLLGSACTLPAKESIDSLRAALALHPVSDSFRVDLLNQLGYEYWIVNPAQSEVLGKQALTLADSIHYRKGAAFAKRVVGVSYWARGQYPAALQYLTQGLMAYQQLRDHLGMGAMYNNMGLVYQDQGNHPCALRYFEQALEEYKLVENQVQQASALGNIGSVYLQMGQLEKAEKIFLQALEQNKALGRKYGTAVAYGSLGELALTRGKYSQALRYLQASVRIRATLEDQEGLSECYYLMGKANLAQKKYDQAEQFLLRGKAAALRVHSLKWLSAIYETLKNLEVGRGNHPQAIAYFEAFVTAKDSLFSQEKSLQLARLQTQFETLQKEQKLQLQQQELQILRNKARMHLLLRNGLLLGLIAVAAITYLVISRQRLKIRQNKALLLKSREVLHAQQALAKAELENARLQEMKLMQELEQKNKKLTSYSINFIQKNELMEELKSNIDRLKKTQDQHTSRQLSGLNRLVEQSGQIDREWEEFKLHFEEVHKDFYKMLKEHHPDLTNHELKLCTLLKLNMNLKEAANIMGISPESVKKARHRLRKKFNLSREENLIDHIIMLENQTKDPARQVA